MRMYIIVGMAIVFLLGILVGAGIPSHEIIINYIEVLVTWYTVLLALLVIFRSDVSILLKALSSKIEMIKKATLNGNVIEFDKLAQKVNAQEEKIIDQKEALDRQEEIIRELVGFSMASHIYEHMRNFYYKSRDKSEYQEYLYKKNEEFERDMFYLRDHGFIESIHENDYLSVKNLKNNCNLLSEIKLTPVGVYYLELREELEKGKAPSEHG